MDMDLGYHFRIFHMFCEHIYSKGFQVLFFICFLGGWKFQFRDLHLFFDWFSFKTTKGTKKARCFYWRKTQLVTRWWFQTFFNVHPYLGKFSNLTNIFQKGLVQPPTRQSLPTFWAEPLASPGPRFSIRCRNEISDVGSMVCPRYGGVGWWSSWAVGDLEPLFFAWFLLAPKIAGFFISPKWEEGFFSETDLQVPHFWTFPETLVVEPTLSRQNSKPYTRHISQVGRKAFARTCSFSNVIFAAWWEEGEQEASKKAMTFGESHTWIVDIQRLELLQTKQSLSIFVWYPFQ